MMQEGKHVIIENKGQKVSKKYSEGVRFGMISKSLFYILDWNFLGCFTMGISGTCHTRFLIFVLEMNLEFFSACNFYQFWGLFLHAWNKKTIPNIKNPVWQVPDIALNILVPKYEKNFCKIVWVRIPKRTAFFQFFVGTNFSHYFFVTKNIFLWPIQTILMQNMEYNGASLWFSAKYSK